MPTYKGRCLLKDLCYNFYKQIHRFGMLLANVPVVLIGKLSADKMPLDLIRKITALLFVALALAAAIFH